MKRYQTITLSLSLILAFSTVGARDLGITRPSHVGFHMIGTRQDASQMSGSGIGLGAEIFLRYPLSSRLDLNIGAGYMTATDDVFKANKQKAILLPSIEARVSYKLAPSPSFATYIYAGVHVYSEEVKVKNMITDNWDGSNNGYSSSVVVGLAAEVTLTESGHRLSVSADYRYGAFSSLNTKPQYWVGKVGMAINLRKREGQPPHNSDYYEDLNTFMANREESGATGPELQTEDSAMNSRLEMVEALAKSNAHSIEAIQGSASAGPTTHKTETATPAVAVDAASYETHYKQGLEKFRAVEYANALQIFKALIDVDAGHTLTGNALYWAGESHFALGQYRQAIQLFDQVLMHKNSPKLDDALLKKGLCLSNLEENAAALTVFNTLIETYPKSEYIERAKKYIKAL